MSDEIVVTSVACFICGHQMSLDGHALERHLATHTAAESAAAHRRTIAALRGHRMTPEEAAEQKADWAEGQLRADERPVHQPTIDAVKSEGKLATGPLPNYVVGFGARNCGYCAFRDRGSWQCAKLQVIKASFTAACEDYRCAAPLTWTQGEDGFESTCPGCGKHLIGLLDNPEKYPTCKEA